MVHVKLANAIMSRIRLGGAGARSASRPEAVGGPFFVLAIAAWFGLSAGLLEVAILTIGKTINGAKRLGALQMNRHYSWMIPTTHLAHLPGLRRRRWSSGRFSAGRCRFDGRRCRFCALSAFSLLLTIKGLYPIAALAFAIGLASKIAPWLARRERSFRRVVWFGLPLSAAITMGLGALSYHRVVLAERRAIASLPAAPEKAPNVLLIVLDTVRRRPLEHLRILKGDHSQPVAVGRAGCSSKRRATAPWTFPSHASMFTGRLPRELGVGGGEPLGTKEPTIAEFLAKHGYATAGFIGNTYFCNSWFGLDRGFAHYEDYYEWNVLVSPDEALRCSAIGRELIKLGGEAYNVRPGTANALKDAERINRDFLRWMETRPDRPFFVFLNYMEAHDPYQTPPGFDRHFGLKPETPADFELIRSWNLKDKKHLAPRELTLISDAYDDCLAYLDSQLGLLFDELDRRGVLDDTLVIVTSDHGEGLGERGFHGHGLSLYRPEIHVPLMIVDPRDVSSGRVVNNEVSLRDLAATVVDRVGLAGESPFPGRSLVRFRNPSKLDHNVAEEPIFSEIEIVRKITKNLKLPPSFRGPLASLVLDGNVYIRDALGREELFDRDEDPDEINDIADSADARPMLERCRAAFDLAFPKDDDDQR